MWHLLKTHQQESFLPFSPRQSLSCCLHHMAEGSTPKPSGPNSHPSHTVPIYSPKASWSSLVWLLHLCLNPHANLPWQPHFQLLPQSVTPAGILVFFQLYWAAIVSLGRRGPVVWSQSSPSSHAGAVARGSCFPVTSWVEVTPISLAQNIATAI